MSNIFHEMKRGFLILGFTGPLNSGCTQAARFFENEVNDYIKKRCTTSKLNIIESTIKSRYELLKETKLCLNHEKEIRKSDVLKILMTYQTKSKNTLSCAKLLQSSMSIKTTISNISQ